MSHNQRIYLIDLLDRIERIRQIYAMGTETFQSSFLHQDALIRNFEVIGEIIKRIDPNLLAQQPNINWRGYTGFRDVLIHQYDKIILDIVWQSAGVELDNLEIGVQALLNHLSSDNDSTQHDPKEEQ